MPTQPTQLVPPRRMLVIGYGNALRQDDAAGIRVAERLAALEIPGLTVRCVHQLLPELADDLARSDQVVFVDARRAAEPGETIRIDPIQPDPNAWSAVGHTGAPAALLALSRLAFERSPGEAWMVTIPAIALELGEGLSPAAEQGVEQALAAVLQLLEPAGTVTTGEPS